MSCYFVAWCMLKSKPLSPTFQTFSYVPPRTPSSSKNFTPTSLPVESTQFSFWIITVILQDLLWYLFFYRNKNVFSLLTHNEISLDRVPWHFPQIIYGPNLPIVTSETMTPMPSVPTRMWIPQTDSNADTEGKRVTRKLCASNVNRSKIGIMKCEIRFWSSRYV